ncbi:hypothetical protein LOTGIDRAFT_170738 [Lottia gigantea]|uniref:Tumor necrosis factor receptor superfamily member 6 n=1 Tax=Lottia gigantea TaxID=225164 RepID=V4AJX4_LOTGI|nr:hypothetical protein LOTGIDRAFT_170738 [Lottia gigantea]ESP04494.1 hypothetical protein LOTGIDRAFT_170738 [Lottia gigantea]
MTMFLLAFLLPFTFQIFQVEGIEDTFYYHNNIQCIKCKRGQKISNHCTSPGGYSECVPCEEGTYAFRLSSSTSCGKCKDCSHTDQIIKKNCTPERDTECQCPDKKYYDLELCKSCEPPRIKKVRDEKEYCEECDHGTYFNNTVKNCVKCDPCTGDQVTHVCNATHNTCIQLSTTTAGLSGLEMALTVIVIGLVIVIALLVILYCLKEKKKCCFRKNEDILSSKPEWLKRIRKILIKHLDKIDLFVEHLVTQEFNATAKWAQLDNKDIETRFSKFMNLWYEQTKDPSLTQILSALEEIDKNDLIKTIQNNDNLKEQLVNEETERQNVSCDMNNIDEVRFLPRETMKKIPIVFTIFCLKRPEIHRVRASKLPAELEKLANQ